MTKASSKRAKYQKKKKKKEQKLSTTHRTMKASSFFCGTKYPIHIIFTHKKMEAVRKSLHCLSSPEYIRQDIFSLLEQEFNQYDQNLMAIIQRDRLFILTLLKNVKLFQDRLDELKLRLQQLRQRLIQCQSCFQFDNQISQLWIEIIEKRSLLNLLK
ncbi:uncharacterized protein LOC113798656 isoform X1 [Dermatophagoides pteronyssinus]|uniref:uncharacterized protein LOC113798656 isoform X1 n=2 Tax=Dermatophagoides pteronyssinus TaxID=6956 RepID=UPI003F67DD31